MNYNFTIPSLPLTKMSIASDYKDHEAWIFRNPAKAKPYLRNILLLSDFSENTDAFHWRIFDIAKHLLENRFLAKSISLVDSSAYFSEVEYSEVTKMILEDFTILLGNPENNLRNNGLPCQLAYFHGNKLMPFPAEMSMVRELLS